MKILRKFIELLVAIETAFLRRKAINRATYTAVQMVLNWGIK